jgi:hypothetical protein
MILNAWKINEYSCLFESCVFVSSDSLETKLENLSAKQQRLKKNSTTWFNILKNKINFITRCRCVFSCSVVYRAVSVGCILEENIKHSILSSKYLSSLITACQVYYIRAKFV